MQTVDGDPEEGAAPGPVDLSLLHAFLLEQNKVFTAAPGGGSIQYHSRQWSTYSGIAPERINNLTWANIIHPDDASKSSEHWLRSVDTGQNFEIEQRLKSADGTYRWHLTRAQLIRNAEGEGILWLGTCQDIEDQKIAEESLRRSDKLAAVGKLAASIAHEINNPLEAVTNLLFLLSQDDSLSPESREYVETAQAELARAGEIANQTLRFYRQRSAAQHCSMGELLRSLLQLYQGRLSQRSISVRFEEKPTDPIMCYSGELRQVFANLISNAIDAMRLQGGIMRVRVKPGTVWSSNVPGVRITITDTGVGMDEATRTRIYEAFFTTKRATGTGLGLWVSAEIVAKHKGSMHVRSQLRRGTAFTVILPLNAADVTSS